jgi:enoyl-[acyl-carrier-protein] reductase (NADH)
MEDGKRVEIQVEWSDASSPKGVKIKKTLVDLSDYCIIIYVAKNFMIREVCFLDSEYVSRKFSNKGHTIFLKDSDVSSYFFSKSSKHFDKIINPITFLKYSSPNLAMKLSEKLSSQ